MGFRGLPAQRRAIAFLALPLLLLGTIPAQADSETQGDSTPPVLLSVGPPASSGIGYGDVMEIDYEMASESGLSWVEFRFTSPIGRSVWLRDSALDGDVENEVGQHWPTGTYTLESVEAGDGADNWIYFRRDGSIGYDSDEGSHSVDFSAADFTVVNDAADVTAPTLVSVSAEEGPIGAGETARITYEATDASSIDYAYFWFLTPGGKWRSVGDVDWDGAVDGVAEMKVRNYTPNGPYILEEVLLVDKAGLQSHYTRSGDATWWPRGATAPSTSSVDLSLGDLAIDNPNADDVRPTLSGVGIASGQSFFDGERVVLNYDAQDPVGIQYVRATYRGPSGSKVNRYDYSSGYGDYEPPDGKLAIDQEWKDLEPGAYELQSITLEDRSGNDVAYRRDGRMTSAYGYRVGDHNIDLSAGDFSVSAWPYAYSDQAGRGLIKFDVASQKFRFQRNVNDQGPGVRKDLNLTVTAGVATIRYNEEGLSVVGTFILGSPRFTAIVQRGNASIIHLIRAV
jgi:hypothetical protein